MEGVDEYYSPIGRLKIYSEREFITKLTFDTDKSEILPSEATIECKVQLESYFNSTLTEFKLSLKPKGTEFQLRVWDGLRKIPFGDVKSYIELSRELGDERAVRAVGAANGRNPIAIIIPCHRIIGSNRRSCWSTYVSISAVEFVMSNPSSTRMPEKSLSPAKNFLTNSFPGTYINLSANLITMCILVVFQYK